METQERICGLCLKLCDTYKAVEGDVRNIVAIVLPKIDLAALKEPVMCTLCTDMLTKCFDFKTACFCTYDYIVPFVNKNKAKLNLKDVYLSKNGISVLEEQDICAFCMSPVRNFHSIPLNIEEKDVMLAKMMEQCLPGLDLSIIKKPVICALCHESLGNYFHFITKRLRVEEKTNKYCETLDLERKGQIELSGLLQFTMTAGISEVVGDPVNVIKVEKQFCDDSENATEKIDHEHKSFVDTSGQKFEVIKIEETFCGENESEVNRGNPFGCRKFLVKEEPEIKTNEQDFNSTKYCENPDLIRKDLVGQLTMRDVSPNEIDGTSINAIKVEKQFCDDNETAIDTNDHKYENFMDTNDQQFSLKNLLDSNKFKMIKKEETFCGRNEPEVNDGNLVGVEDQKCFVKDEIEIKTNEQDFNSTSYYETPDLNKKDRVELGRLLQYGTCEVDDAIKVEKQFCDDSETATEKIDHKNKSFTDTNDPKFANEQEFSLKNLLASNKFEMIKIEDTFGGENNRFGDDVLQQSEFTSRLCRKRECLMPTLEGDPLRIKHTANNNTLKTTLHKCDICSFQTKRSNHLKRHLLVHKDPSEVTMYKCDFCSFQTKHKRHLKVHVLVHKDPSEVTMYKCDSCSFQTKHKGSLKSHLLVHKSSLEVITYHCDSCSYQTTRKSHLNRHLLVHKRPSEVTMYKCDSCLFETKYKSYLKDHLLKHENHSNVTPKQNKHVVQWTLNGGRQ